MIAAIRWQERCVFFTIFFVFVSQWRRRRSPCPVGVFMSQRRMVRDVDKSPSRMFFVLFISGIFYCCFPVLMAMSSFMLVAKNRLHPDREIITLVYDAQHVPYSRV